MNDVFLKDDSGSIQRFKNRTLEYPSTHFTSDSNPGKNPGKCRGKSGLPEAT